MAELVELENYAKQHSIPIMQKDGIEFLCKHIKKERVKHILELGTAIGYSAICMALVDKDIHITTIERDKNRYEEALKNIKKFHLEEQITVLFGDAFDIELEEQYDLLFIDAAKSQYTKFFTKCEKNVKAHGTIVSDNLSFHGLVEAPLKEGLSRNVRGLIRKIKSYITFLKEQPAYNTTFYDIGDGISISKKK